MKNLGGLASIGDLSALLKEPGDGAAPLEIPLELIDEDPSQPRSDKNPGFSRESLEELAASIRERGVKSPISVRAGADGRYLLNHGARRYRASKLAGKGTIPAFIDDDFTDEDQIIENIQREGLTPREIAEFIGRKLSQGLKKGEIARKIGKSPAYITQHTTLLNLPDPIAKAFSAGRTNDVTLLNELNAAYKANPKEVETMLADEDQEISRGSVKALRDFIQQQREVGFVSNQGASASESDSAEPQLKKKNKDADPEKLRRPILQVEHDGRIANILIDRRPTAEGCAYFKYIDDGQVFEADFSTVRLVALIGD